MLTILIIAALATAVAAPFLGSDSRRLSDGPAPHTFPALPDRRA